MRLIATENGQIYQPFVGDEVRPASGFYLPDLLRGLAERYGFMTIPNWVDVTKEGAKYSQGRLLTGGEIIEIKSLQFYPDGIIVTAWNTEDADKTLDDVIAWVTDTFRFKEPITPRPRRYTSTVIIEFDHTVDTLLDKFHEFRQTLATAYAETYGNVVLETSRLAFSTDPSRMPPLTKAEFTIERRADIPYSQNRYFSAATTRTQTHLQLLQDFERLW
jgi:hypothetical protein